MPHQPIRNVFALVCLALAAVNFTGCAWLAGANERLAGKSVAAQYYGLNKKSVAIVVYTDQAIRWEYPGAREEITRFIAAEMHLKMPDVRLLDYREVIRWQDATVGWEALPEKDIARHFGVDRVLYIEVNSYATRERGASDLLHGQLKTAARVFEVETSGNTAAWHGDIEASFPDVGNADPNANSDDTVRRRTLERYAQRIVNLFYDHKEIEPSIREKSL